MQCLEINLCLY